MKAPPKDSALTRAEVRLLEALAALAAYAAEDELGPGLVIVAQRGGASSPAGRATAQAGAALAARDLACWSTGRASGRRRLTITDAGRAALARAMAPSADAAFLAQHTTLERRGSTLIDAEESPLAWLARRKLVDAAEFEAGERLRLDLEIGAILPRVTANWSSSVASGARGAGPGHVTDLALAARQRVSAAMAAAGPEFSGLLMDVCGFLKGLETIEAERGWPRRSAKVVLRMALAGLARHYGVASQALGPGRSRGVRHWGAEDYRPRIGPLER